LTLRKDPTGKGVEHGCALPNTGHKEPAMQALKDLFTTDYGLMSIIGLAFILGMAVYFVHYFISHMHAEEARMRAEQQPRS
jgi:hypothetical protein